MKKKFIFFLCLSCYFFNIFAGKSIRHLLNHKKIPRVQNGVLDLSNKNINDLNGIEKYPKIKQVRELILKDNKIQSLEPLTKIVSLKKIRKLDLAGNKIKNLDAILKFLGIKELYVESNKLSDKEIEKIKKAREYSLLKLNVLYLELNPLKNMFLKYLINNKGLRNFNYLGINECADFIGTVKIYKILEKNKKNKENLNEICSICRNEENYSIYITECGHYFHKKCLKNWLKISSKRNCPYCRKTLT